jgi:hypothetical protein
MANFTETIRYSLRAIGLTTDNYKMKIILRM